MTKLSQPQCDLLQALHAAGGEAERDDAAPTTIASLIKRGLVISVPRAGQTSLLMITAAGRAEIGVTEEAPSKAAAPPVPSEPEPASQPGGKIGALLALLRRPEGATLDAMMAATGWQAHSVRGAMSGAIKRSRGIPISSETCETGRIYRAAAAAQ